MRDRAMVLAWVGIALLLLIVFIYEIGKWRALSTEGARAAAERERLTKEIRQKEEEIVKEMRANATLLQEMQWTASGSDPSAFLTRFADLVQEKRMRILSIGAVERAATAQFSKSWHTVQVLAPFREVKELAGRVETEKGILEDMVLEAPREQAPRSGPGAEEVQARFKMTALELTPEAKKVFERSMAAAGPAPGQAPAPLALPTPTRVAEGPSSAARDPFLFGSTPLQPGRRPVAVATAPSGAGPPPRAAAAPEPAAPKPEVPLEVKGIVSFPGGYLAIVNNQIVKVGDTVSGHRVERITDNTVTFRVPEGGSRTVPLPDLVGGTPAGPRR